eukprot:scaffold31391_cov64-Phaeocystis_antarctica.AAC.4
MSRGLTKTKRRMKIASSERVDNNFACLSKALGHKRTKETSRGIKVVRAQLASDLGKLLSLANLDPDFAKACSNVHDELQYLNAQSNLNRAPYTSEFKASLQWLCTDAGISFLKSAELRLFIEEEFAARPLLASDETDESLSVTTEQTEALDLHDLLDLFEDA